MLQYYDCERCGLQSSVELPTDATVPMAVNKIKWDHELQSPNCAFDPMQVKVYRGAPPDTKQQ